MGMWKQIHNFFNILDNQFGNSHNLHISPKFYKILEKIIVFIDKTL